MEGTFGKTQEQSCNFCYWFLLYIWTQCCLLSEWFSLITIVIFLPLIIKSWNQSRGACNKPLSLPKWVCQNSRQNRTPFDHPRRMELRNPLPKIFSEQGFNQKVPFIFGDISKLTSRKCSCALSSLKCVGTRRMSPYAKIFITELTQTPQRTL